MSNPRQTISQILETPDLHEKKITEFFQGKVFFDGHYPVFSRPLTILAFTNRCGSNLLAEYLNQTGQVGGFHESLNHDTVENEAKRQGIQSFPDYVHHVYNRFSVKSNFGVKASWEQLSTLARTGVLKMFPSVEVIHMKRADVVSQAISHWIACQNKKWTSRLSGVDVDPRYSFNEIDGIISGINISNGVVPIIAELIGVKTVEVFYEDLTENPKETMEKISHSTSLDFSEWKLLHPRIEKQANETNVHFRSRFIDDLRSVLYRKVI